MNEIASTKTRKRCAVYCRVSTDERLDQEFNSIDAQKEAGHAYIASQRTEGWISVAEPRDVLAKRVAQFRADAGYDVPLAMFGAPIKPDYWSTAEELGFGQLGLRLPSLGTDESLRLLDEFAAQVARYRSAH